MRMQSLQNLHRSMRALGVDMQKFQVRTGAADFDCLFSTRDTPFALALTSRGLDPQFFKFNVEEGYCIYEYFGDMYGPLVNVLRLDGRNGERLVPRNFLIQLDAGIPNQAHALNVPEPEEIIRSRPDLEENDRPYFDTWSYWGEFSGKSPSPENIHKTLVALARISHHSIE